MTANGVKIWEGSGLNKTYDYSMFKFLEYNRDIDHEKKVEKSFLDVGAVPIPIIVNENNEIIDGQHRFVVSKKLGLPIFYIVVPGLSIKQCGTINAVSKIWSVKNHVHAHTSPEYEDNETYIFYELLDKEFKDLGTTMLSDILAPMYKTSGRGVRNMVAKKKFKITMADYEYLKKKGEWFRELAVVRKKLQGTTESLFEAASYAYEMDKVDRIRLKEQIIANVSELTPVGNIDSALRDLQIIYNRNKKKAKVYFQIEYDKFREGQHDINPKH